MSNRHKSQAKGINKSSSHRRKNVRKGSTNNRCTSNSQGTSTEETCDIPGFYYDKEKKKYFKIMPNHSMVSGQISKDVIKNIKVEKQRQKDLETFADSRNKPSIQQSSIKGGSSQLRHTKSHNICHMLTNCRLGLTSPELSESSLHKHIIKRLGPSGIDRVVREDSGHGIDKVEDAKFMIMSKDSHTIVGVWSLNSVLGQRMHHMDIEPTKKCTGDNKIKLGLSKVRCVSTLGQGSVTSICWAPKSPDDINTTRALVTATSFIGDENNIVKIWDYASFTDDDIFDMGRQALWSGAWNCHRNSFSIGTDSNSLIVEINTRKMWELSSNKSSVYAQIFSQTGHQLFAGNKRGEILVHDLKSSSTYPISTMKHKISIAHLYHAKDECTLIASDVSGKIKKWDLRQRKVVQVYPGHVNNYVKLPFHVDNNEKLLYAVGEDCYTRMWCYKTGELLKTIPSPFPVSVDRIPAVAYSDTMGGPGGLPGLLMAVKGELHLYSL